MFNHSHFIIPPPLGSSVITIHLPISDSARIHNNSHDSIVTGLTWSPWSLNMAYSMIINFIVYSPIWPLMDPLMVLLFTKVLPRSRQEYFLNKFTYWELKTNDKSIIIWAINGHPGDYTIKLTIIEYAIISDRGEQVNPVTVESCKLLILSAGYLWES